MTGLLNRLFGHRPAEEPLAPLLDPALGLLRWDEDAEGWVGDIARPEAGSAARLYIGAGSAGTYPAEAMLDLLRPPYREFWQLAPLAQDYLCKNMDIDDWLADPQAFRVQGLESYGHHLAEGVYTITFTNGDSEAVWKVHFQAGQPVGCGIDD